MLSTKRLLLGLLVLGVVAMHGLVTSSGTTAGHHGIAASTSTSVFQTAAQAVQTSVQAAPTPHDHARSAAPSDDARERGGSTSTALALCMALLLVLGVTAFGGRRTTWVADLATRVTRIPLPLPPVLRDRTPVPRFTVMRC